MFLLQNGGTLYNQDMSRTNMTGKASIEAFAAWTDLYVKYGLPKSFDILNRFRTQFSEMLRLSSCARLDMMVIRSSPLESSVQIFSFSK